MDRLDPYPDVAMRHRKCHGCYECVWPAVEQYAHASSDSTTYVRGTHSATVSAKSKPRPKLGKLEREFGLPVGLFLMACAVSGTCHLITGHPFVYYLGKVPMLVLLCTLGYAAIGAVSAIVAGVLTYADRLKMIEKEYPNLMGSYEPKLDALDMVLAGVFWPIAAVAWLVIFAGRRARRLMGRPLAERIRDAGEALHAHRKSMGDDA